MRAAFRPIAAAPRRCNASVLFDIDWPPPFQQTNKRKRLQSIHDCHHTVCVPRCMQHRCCWARTLFLKVFEKKATSLRSAALDSRSVCLCAPKHPIDREHNWRVTSVDSSVGYESRYHTSSFFSYIRVDLVLRSPTPRRRV